MSKLSQLKGVIGSPEDVPPSPFDQEPETPEERRERHYRQCGTYKHAEDAGTGKTYSFRWDCNHAGCKKCRKRRGEEVRESILEAGEFNNLYIAYMPNNKETNNFLYGIGKEEYSRFPCEEYDVVILRDDHGKGKLLTRHDIEELDCYTMALRVEGRKKSGNLCPSKKRGAREEAGEPFRFLTHTVHAECANDDGTFTNIDKDTSDIIAEEIMLETVHLDPKNGDEINQAFHTTMVARVKAYQRHGFTSIRVESKWVNGKLPLSIDWRPIREKLLQRHTLRINLERLEQPKNRLEELANCIS